MKKILIKNLKQGDVIICRGEEGYKKAIELLSSFNYKWKNGKQLNEIDNYSDYKKRTVLLIGENKRITFSNFDYLEENMDDIGVILDMNIYFRNEKQYNEKYCTEYECIEAIEKITKPYNEFEDYLTNNIFKYLFKWKSKSSLNYLEKTKLYLDRLIEEVESNE